MLQTLLCLGYLASLPSEAAEVLGFDPRTALSFTALYEREKAPVKEAEWTVRKVEIANCGGNRFVFGVHFSASYAADNAVLILYLDSDNNSETGRKNHGCEYMLTLHDRQSSVTAFAPGGERVPASRPRALVGERSVWFSYDFDAPQIDDRSLFQLAVLSEKSKPHVGVDHVRYRLCRGPPISPQPKTPLPEDLLQSLGFGRVSGLRRIESTLGRDGVARVPVSKAQLRGFRLDRSEYRRENVYRNRSGGEIRFVSPAEGQFYVGALVHDGPGKDLFRVKINDRILGTIVGIWDDRKQHLFFSRKSVRLEEGQEVSFMSLGEGRHRFEEVLFLPQKPREERFAWEFRRLSCHADSVCFTTTWPATCELETDEGTSKEAVRSENHRMVVPGAREGSGRRFRLKSRTPEGREVMTGWLEHHWALPETGTQQEKGEVRLEVDPPRDLTLEDWPVSSGVPFPRGELAAETKIALRCGDSQLPLQTRVLARWPDGTIKWLLTDFRHLGGRRDYVLEYGPQVNRKRQTVAPEPLDAGSLSLVRGDGKSFVAPLHVRLEEHGFLRQCFLGGGNLRAPDGERFFRYEIRLHAYPGLPYVRALVTVGADGTCPEFAEVRSLSWRVPLRGSGANATPFHVKQYRDDRYETSAGESGKRWQKPIGPVLVRDFWQNYPKVVGVAEQHATVELLPPLRAKEYAWARGTMDEHRLFFWLKNGKYNIRQGMSKTHEVWLGLDGSSPPFDRVLMAVCEPRWAIRSGVFGALPDAGAPSPVLRLYDQAVEKAFRTYLQNREKNREYGLFNFGDWWGERVINWGNVEYDTQHALFLQFVRTGDLRFFHAGEEAELHNRDIDTKFWHRDPSRVGTVAAHAIGHVGGYYAASPHKGRGSPRAHISVSHTWCEGHLDHYFLTGDRRSLEAARRIADHFDMYELDGYDFTNTRIPGWHLILTLALYRATGEPFYLNAAHIIVERVLERQTLSPFRDRPPGGWARMMVPGHCHCDPFHYGNAGFMVGVLLTGLKLYHQETGDERVGAAIVKGAKFLIEDMWVPERTGFRYTSCPKSSAGVWSNLLLADGLAYAHKLSGDEKIAAVLRRAIPAGIDGISGFGKGFGQVTRVAPHALARAAAILE